MKDSTNYPLVSVLLTAYKEPLEFFSEAIKSIQNQTYKNLEIIILIDNPEDLILENYARKIALLDNRIAIIRNQKNLGLARSLNKAIMFSSGDYICRMDADDIALNNRIENQFDYLVNHQLDLIGAYVDTISHSGEHLYYVNNIPVDPQTIRRALLWNNVVPHPTWFGTKTIFKQLYREIPLCEDYDFLLRSISNNYAVGNLPKVALKYRMSEKSISRSNLYLQYLSQCILTNSYRRKGNVSPEKIENFKRLNFKKNKAIRYEKGNSQFNKALELINNGHLLLGITKILLIPGISLSYTNKIRRLLLASLASFSLPGK